MKFMKFPGTTKKCTKRAALLWAPYLVQYFGRRLISSHQDSCEIIVTDLKWLSLKTSLISTLSELVFILITQNCDKNVHIWFCLWQIMFFGFQLQTSVCQSHPRPAQCHKVCWFLLWIGEPSSWACIEGFLITFNYFQT